MRRQGLTLVEVAVVVFLLVILLGLMMPSIRRTHGISGRTQSNNNLKQCALAVHDYHDTYRRLPDGMNVGGIYAKGDGMSMWFHLLPYVEADNVYKSTLTAIQYGSVIPSYNAPSDPFNLDNAGTLNFAGNIRVFGHETLGAKKVNEPGVALDLPEGKMISNLTLPRIVDGAANVIMMTTRYAVCADQKTWYGADVYGKNLVFDDKARQPFPPSPGVGGFMGAGSHNTAPARNGAPITAMFQLAPTVNGCVPQAGLFGHSFGTTGISVALCDASIRHIPGTMSPTTFSRALCPGDQNPLGRAWEIE
jgi:type II secretory pathway pseudopilin PulG